METVKQSSGISPWGEKPSTPPQRPSVSSYWRRNCGQLSACSVQRLEKLPLPAWNTVKQGRIRR